MPPPPIPVAQPAHGIPEPDYYANGPFLVMRKDAALPDRCIQCNEPADGRTFRKRLIWSDRPIKPGGGVADRLILPVRVIYALDDLARFLGSLRTFTKATVDLPICAKHFAHRCFWNPLAWLAIPAGIAAAVLIQDLAVRIWMPFLGVALTMFARYKAHHVGAAHIGITHVTLTGISPAFLNSLPPREPPKEQPASVSTIIASTSELKERMKARREAL